MQKEFIFTNKWSDLVFENRNQSYGGFVLRKRLPDNILIGYLVAVSFLGSLLFIGYQFSKISIDDIGKIIDNGTVTLFDGSLKPPPVEPAKRTEQSKPPSKPPVNNAVPIVIDSAIENKEKEKSDDTKLVSEFTDTAGTNNNPDETNSKGKEETNLTSSVEPYDLVNVQKVPEFKGGFSAMMKFIRNNVKFPEKYLTNGDGGTVYVSFVIDTSGNVTSVKVKQEVKGLPEFTGEALRAVSKMPQWIPGQQNGRNVPVILTLPIKFAPIKGY
jgi:protein TonB